MRPTSATKVLMLGLTSYLVIASVGLGVGVTAQELPTTYDYFTEGGIQSGLTANTRGLFKLNGQDIRIVSGAIHYFRVHPDHWRDRLRKLRALGANTVETYVPWNLHEPERGVFDFGEAGRDYSALLNLRRFVQLAQEEDLLVLFRPGPYICAEWEFGGLPSWLLRDPGMQVRTAYAPYMEGVKVYLDNLLPQVADLQFTRGGSIIAIQIENEYGQYWPRHVEYMAFIKDVFEANGFVDGDGDRGSLMFTSDNMRVAGSDAWLDGVLLTANFQTDPALHMGRLLEIQPNRPILVAEYWTGWFDTWLNPHESTRPEDLAVTLEIIFQEPYNASVNFYMFIGGTNFGFTAGANPYPQYRAGVTSYDYDSILTAAGDYTAKYGLAQQLIERYQIPRLHRPAMPSETPKFAPAPVQLQKYLTWYDILARVPASSRFMLQDPSAVSMEQLDMNNGSGQRFGYIVYRKVLPGRQTRVKVGPVKDFGVLLIDGVIQQLPDNAAGEYWINEELEFNLQLDEGQSYLLEVFVENMGRVNAGDLQEMYQRKGIGKISIDGVPATDFQVLALEFKSEWVTGLGNWHSIPVGGTDPKPTKGPVLFQSEFTIPSGSPAADTFLDMRAWHKGVVFVNGFNVGRYFKAGPQQTLFIPAPLLRDTVNTVTIFEQFEPGTNIQFLDHPILDQLASE